MAVNQYFNNISHTGTQNLIEDNVVEVIQIGGIDVYYIERKDQNVDYLFNEDDEVTYEDGTLIEVKIKSVEGWDGQGDIFAKFGLQVNDSATFSMAKRRFAEELGHLSRPKEGDLIYFPVSKTLLEIKFVEHEDPFYQQGKQYVYELKCELFSYGNEDFATGVPEIDNLITELESERDVDTGYADNTQIETEGDSVIVPNPSNPFD